jgi:hypothetical protein
MSNSNKLKQPQTDKEMMRNKHVAPSKIKQLVKAAAVLIILTQSGLAVSAAGPADESAVRTAWALYNQQKYAESADAFEAVIKTSTPNARLYYYAALANKSSNRVARAKQLSQYVIANFAGSAEAASAQKLFADSTAKNASASDGLPESLKGKTVEELMQTEEGRKALKEALKQQKGSTGTSAPAAATATPSTASTATSTSSAAPLMDKSKHGKESVRPFTSEDIAKDGSGGISQFSYHPNSWFEASLAALAILPRGQESLARMIQDPSGRGTYIVRFPADGVEYTITPQKMEACRVRDKALWATVIHCAQIMKFHGNAGSLEDGLHCLTGKNAEKLYPANTTQQALVQFIVDAIKAQNPVICESADDFGALTELVETEHAYTIIGFDLATNMINIRDPHGDNSRRFRLKTDPEHQKFEQLNDGMFRMHISLFPQYFTQVARASL